MHPILARLVAISIAMVAGWLAHRRFTFRLTAPPSFAEFLRYAGGAAGRWRPSTTASSSLIVLLRPAIEPLYALFASSLVAMVFAYLGTWKLEHFASALRLLGRLGRVEAPPPTDHRLALPDHASSAKGDRNESEMDRPRSCLHRHGIDGAARASGAVWR